ncbi:hypothetical protein AX774_g1241 [Zancudomyces culisetae]|uniref:Uncharacterized protein n=1 Tax=Zancudomyces culisetae TaxID=1213189 RepID=A0A1R1PW86_ZANCU|nr:hypothetical protein AX774_g1241 [Zancudomyces culisetae]|eukprot:OMH85217.1 hypothetical protein AX774_g1241 [Zancudomyces culisetae]
MCGVSLLSSRPLHGCFYVAAINISLVVQIPSFSPLYYNNGSVFPTANPKLYTHGTNLFACQNAPDRTALCFHCYTSSTSFRNPLLTDRVLLA